MYDSSHLKIPTYCFEFTRSVVDLPDNLCVLLPPRRVTLLHMHHCAPIHCYLTIIIFNGEDDHYTDKFVTFEVVLLPSPVISTNSSPTFGVTP